MGGGCRLGFQRGKQEKLDRGLDRARGPAGLEVCCKWAQDYDFLKILLTFVIIIIPGFFQLIPPMVLAWVGFSSQPGTGAPLRGATWAKLEGGGNSRGVYASNGTHTKSTRPSGWGKWDRGGGQQLGENQD